MLRLESTSTTAEPLAEEGDLPRPGRARRPELTQDLLTRYARTGTSECFEEIVRRYGAMVLAVCQSVTRNRHDAEDATQVTFFVLAERLRAGETIRSLGSWLQQVARRAAVDIRRSGTRRQRRERNRSSPEIAPDSVAEQFDGDQVAALVREELDRVPTKYRVPLVLHYFGGLDFAEAARELGLKPATLGVRLFRGRKLLGERLARRGVALSAPALAVCLARVVRSSLSHALRQSAAQVACTSGLRPLAAAPPLLGHGLLSALVSSKVKLAMAAALVVAGAAGARAAVHHFPDLPSLLDLGRLRPKLPSIRSTLPHLRADAGDSPSQLPHPQPAAPVAGPAPGPLTIDPSRPAVTVARPAPPAPGGTAAGGGVITYASSINSHQPAPLAGRAGSHALAPGPSEIASTPRASGLPGAPSAPSIRSHEKPNAAIAMAPSPSAARGAGSTPIAYAPLKPTGAAGTAPIGSVAVNTLAGTMPGSAPAQSAPAPNGSVPPAAPIPPIAMAPPAPTFPASPTAPSGATAIGTGTSPKGSSPVASGGTYAGGQSSPGAAGAAGLSPGTSAGTKPAGSPYAGLLRITSTGLNSSELSFLNPDDPSVPTLPGKHTFVGVWAVPTGQVADVPLTLSFDRQLLTDLGRDPSQVSLWTYDGKWSLVSDPGSNDSATVNNPTAIRFFAIGTPEPTGAAIGAVAGLLLLMRRRRRASRG